MMQCKSNLSRVMETGDHFKNGASSKSHTSRVNFLRKASFALLAAGIIFSGCKKEKDNAPVFDTKDFNGVIESKVVGGDEYNSKISTINAYFNWDKVIVTGTYSNGGFKITLPNPPSASFLYPVSQ